MGDRSPTSCTGNMNSVSYEFSAPQREVLNRYIRWLGLLIPTYDSTPVVFEARRKSGHQRAELSWDTRLNRVNFYEQYLQESWERIRDLRSLTSRYLSDLDTFGRESLEITQRTSKRAPVSQVDVTSYSLYRSTDWGRSPPTSPRGLVHQLGNCFWSLSGVINPIEGQIDMLGEASFGLNAAFIKIMGWQSCACHPQPTVAQELFRNSATTPPWDIAYSSSDPTIRAAEFQADIAKLFNEFVPLNIQMGVFLRNVSERARGLGTALTQTENMTTMGLLNFKIESALEGADEILQMLTHFENWLKK
ncbi:hypothetical protein [Pseudomonas sp. 13B_3.2_Bac1]|uniref:hypothetical protein n=1 Tax=Pseudomonas sp. 13B_3.2_Bac1 TaxID=2971623 RepID=UPI0021C8A577|nr:hypothetical protein [Pseudomonas sp. 13B_3.2_Bac1]MCU1775274.1 hypothetical protein [Pseudomonas sp. 13B_3.2_Bac1]